jgi:very-short-patch-repair endonuclease
MDLPRGVVRRGAQIDLTSLNAAIVSWAPTKITGDGVVIDVLDRAALALYPVWLPGAEWIEGPGGLGVAAVRSLAHDLAAATSHHGPFLADLAERALRGCATGVRFPDPVRIAGLARVIASTSPAAEMVLVVNVPADWSASDRADLLTQCQRLSALGGFNVWLRDGAANPEAVTTVTSPDLETPPCYPPSAGAPHPASLVEVALENALCRKAWAAGRQWNQTYRVHPLANPVRPDLLWPEDRLIVEIDGPEHLEPAHFAADRRRDVDLQLAGYAVLRFTNAEIQHDVAAVVSRIERFVQSRRSAA